MKTLNKFFLLTAFLLTINALSAQIQFKMVFDQEEQHYVVSMISDATYEAPYNITGTGQVTIKVPSNLFEPANVTNLHDQMVWHSNSRANAPNEASDYDYISFGLMNPGVSNPDYKEGEEIFLFSFENAYGCTGIVELVDNATDPFMAPNSRNVNIGNTVTIFGAGGEAFDGLVGDGKVNCMATSTTELAEITEFAVFPNPVIDYVNVEIYWEETEADAVLKILDARGKTLDRTNITLQNGANVFELDASQYASGVYWLEVVGKDWKLNLDRFFKGN